MHGFETILIVMAAALLVLQPDLSNNNNNSSSSQAVCLAQLHHQRLALRLLMARRAVRHLRLARPILALWLSSKAEVEEGKVKAHQPLLPALATLLLPLLLLRRPAAQLAPLLSRAHLAHLPHLPLPLLLPHSSNNSSPCSNSRAVAVVVCR